MKLLYTYFMQALRTLAKYRSQTAISVVGLAFGLVCLTFSVNWFWYETHYDNFRPDYRNIYVVKSPNSFSSYSLSQPYLLAEQLRENAPALTDVMPVMNWGDTWGSDFVVDGQAWKCPRGFLMAPDSFFVKYPLTFVRGDAAHAFQADGSVVIVRSLAERVFGTLDVVGRPVTVRDEPRTITGVVEDPPANTNLPADLYFVRPKQPTNDDLQWGNYNYKMLVRVDPDRLSEVPAQLERVSDAVLRTKAAYYYGDSDAAREYLADSENRSSYFLMPLSRAGKQAGPDTFWKDFMYPAAFTGLSLLLVLSALFNYFAILTSLFVGRLREYRLRISLGATFRSNVGWLLTEVGLTLVVVAVLSALCLELAVYWADMADVCADIYRVFALCLLAVVAVMAVGLTVPFWYLRRLYRAQFSGRTIRLRNHGALLVLQTAVCGFMLLIFVGTGRQFRLMLNSDLGFTTARILRVGNLSRDVRTAFFDISARLRDQRAGGIVDAVSVSYDVMNATSWYSRSLNSFLACDASHSDTTVRMSPLTDETIRFFDMKVKDGPGFDTRSTTMGSRLILNPGAAALFARTDRWKELLSFQGNPSTYGGVLDVRLTSFDQELPPMVYYYVPDGQFGQQRNIDAIYVRYAPGRRTEAEQTIRAVMKDYVARVDELEIQPLTEHIASFYKDELLYYRLFTGLLVGSLVITLFGVFSMVTYTLRRDRRSIAIRRVYGAGFGALCRKYLAGYVVTALLASLVGALPGLVLVRRWLTGYTERVTLGAAEVVVAVAVVVALVAAVVLVQLWRTLRDNPADVVRADS